MDNFFSSPEISDNLTKKKNCCGTVRLNRKGMAEDLRCNTIKLRWGDNQVRTRRSLTAIDGNDKRDVCMLTNIHDLPQGGNFRNEQGNAIKPKIVADYNHHLGYVDKGNRMANSYPDMEVDEKAVFPSVQTRHSEQLHPSFFMWWEENFTQRFLTRPLCATCWNCLDKNGACRDL
jgi:hypothetical protein